jgi:hypothetical protein
MATLENCHTCYPVSAPECAESYIISGLTPADELVAIATDRFGRTSRVDNETPVNDDGELTLVFPDGMTAWHAPKLSIRLYRLSDYENNRQLCTPLTMTICDVDYSCITLSFHQHSEELASVALICQCTNVLCDEICATISSTDDLPDPTECDFVLVRNINNEDFLLTIQEYHEGDGWHSHFKVFGDFDEGGTISEVNYDILPDRQILLSGGITLMGQGTYTFADPVTSFGVTAVDTTNGCRYNLGLVEQAPLIQCLYSFDLAGLWGDVNQGPYFIRPFGLDPILISEPSDVATIQETFPGFMSNTANINNPNVSTLYFYGEESDTVGWRIMNSDLEYVDLVWVEESCFEQTQSCYSYSFEVDSEAFSQAQVYAINDPNPDPSATPLALSILLFLITIDQFETQMAELLASRYGGSPTVQAAYNGTTFSFTVFNLNDTAPTPPWPTGIIFTIDLEPGEGNFLLAEPDQIACP